MNRQSESKHGISRLLPALVTVAGWLLTPLVGAGAAADRPVDLLREAEGRLVIEIGDPAPPVPVFFSVSCVHRFAVASGAVTGETGLWIQIVQGKPEVLSLGLAGDGEVISVVGEGLGGWAVRQLADGRRLLDLHPVPAADGNGVKPLDLVVKTLVRDPAVPGTVKLPLIVPGEAVGYDSTVRIEPGNGIDLRLEEVSGLLPVADPSLPERVLLLAGSGPSFLTLRLAQRGGLPAEIELLNANLIGEIDPDGKSVQFRLRGRLVVRNPDGARLAILGGGVGLTAVPDNRDWRVGFGVVGAGQVYELVADRAGEFPVDLEFAVAVKEEGDWRVIDLEVSAGAVVPLELHGLESGIEFDPNRPVVPSAAGDRWRGFVPAGGETSVAWKESRRREGGALFFTSTELTDIRIGPGLLRQDSVLELHVLQGKLDSLSLDLEGPGEILSITGTNIEFWRVVAVEEGRRLEIRLSRPVEDKGELIIRSQAALEGFPVRTQALRLLPRDGTRHSGMIRLANTGSVRFEVNELRGLLQLAPDQFAGKAPEKGLRQVFVFRFPSADYRYRIDAAQIQPEIAVSQVLAYELGATDRIISADLELDIREAPVTEWTMEIPEDYTVVTLSGSPVSDYAVGAETVAGYRALKVLFTGPVEGRQLIRVRLERNLAASAGSWVLKPLRFSGVKSVRGHVGVIGAPGFRLSPGPSTHLVETPLSQFPKQSPGLQQAWRIREADWSAAIEVEAMEQSIEADVFHLHTVKTGVAYASILINYFVVGAPSSEWRIAVPETAENLDVVGQNVRRDWRREGDEVIVSFHQPVLGAATLLLTFEQAMGGAGDGLQAGTVRPLGVESERGYVQVVSPHQVRSGIRRAEGGLLKLEPMELPAEYRLLSNAPSLAVFQYTSRPFALEIDLDWYERAEAVDQVVDFASLASTLSRDGQVVTEARYFVKTRGRGSLRLVLPEGVRLWETRVDGAVINAQTDADRTIVPLPARLNPNHPVEVRMRFGHESGKSGRSVLRLTAPRLLAPTVMTEWTLQADPDRKLLPRGGNAELGGGRENRAGFHWIAGRAGIRAGLLFALVLAGGWLLRSRSGWRVPVGCLVLGCAICASLLLMAEAALDGRSAVNALTYTSSVVPPGAPISIRVANLEVGQAAFSWPGILSICAALVVGGLAFRSRDRRRGLLPPALALLAAGLLLQEGGAVVFFGLMALCLFLIVLSRSLRWLRGRGQGNGAGTEGPASSMVTALVLGFVGLSVLGSAELWARERPAPALAEPAAGTVVERIDQEWTIVEGRLRAEATITAHGRAGDSFVLLRTPATLSSFEGEGLRVTKVDTDGVVTYQVAFEESGRRTARARFEMPVELQTRRIDVPTGPAALQRIRLDLDQGGWEMTSPSAVLVTPEVSAPADHSIAVLVLSPMARPQIHLRSRQGGAGDEPAVIFAEAAHLFLPGAGAVDLRSRVLIRPSRGRVSEISIRMPEGFTVGDVGEGPVGPWSFDPKSRLLRVAIEPRQVEAFGFSFEAQMAAAALPVELALAPPRIEGTVGAVGMVALAFGSDARPEALRTTGLSPISLDDFARAAFPREREAGSLPALQRAWRHGEGGAAIDLTVAGVEPEVRVEGRQLVSIDDDRLVLSGTLEVSIARVGLFRLGFALPDGLEVESLSGEALSHWTESGESGQRQVTLHLKEQTLGDPSFAFTLFGPAPAAQSAWRVPRVVVTEATRQTGELLLVPGQGIRLRTVDRSEATPLDPRSVGGFLPGTLAFRLLQKSGSLSVGIEILEPWVTAEALQEVTVREGQTLTRLRLLFRVENSGVRRLRLGLPGLTVDERRTLRMSGSAVADFVEVSGQPGIWEVGFQRAVFGETDLQVEYQGGGTNLGDGVEVVTPVFPDSRATGLYVSVRAGGRIELRTDGLPAGWQRIDWLAVPEALQDRTDRSVPAWTFRVSEPGTKLLLQADRHELADALRLRVTAAELTSVFAVSGPFLTSVNLDLEVLEKATLAVRLPEGARLFAVSVNGASVEPVLDETAHLFHVFPRTGSDSTATVGFVYAMDQSRSGRIELTGPGLNTPLENVSWKVVLPPGYELDDFDGGFRLLGGDDVGGYGLERYQAVSSSARSAEMEEGVALLRQASSLIQSGRQQEAGEILQRASNTRGLDQASNEDARVQLRALKTQQAVLGLNTRRQKLYLDNRTETVRNEQLEQATTVNPFMEGRLDFDPGQVDQLLMGNTVEENAALRGIAARLVDQQLAAEPNPVAIDVTMPERGRLLVFSRSLQVDGQAPLSLELAIGRIDRVGWVPPLAILLGIACLVLVLNPGRKGGSAA